MPKGNSHSDVVADFAKIITALKGRCGFFQQLLQFVDEFPVGVAISAEKLGVLVGHSGSLQSLLKSFSPSCAPNALLKFSDFLAAYQIDDVGAREYATSLNQALEHFSIVAECLQVDDIPDEAAKLAFDALFASRIDLLRLAEYSATRNADVQHLEHGCLLAVLASHRSKLPNIMSIKGQKLPPEETLTMLAKCRSAAKSIADTESEQATFAMRFLFPKHEPAAVSEGIVSTSKLVGDAVDHILGICTQMVNRESAKFSKVLVRADVSRDEFVKEMNIEPLKQKITPFKVVLKLAKDTLSSIDPDLAEAQVVKDAEKVMDTGKAQVNQYACLLLLQTAAIKNVLKGTVWQPRSIFKLRFVWRFDLP